MNEPRHGWNAYWLTTLDEGGHIWLWELLADVENFFPGAAPEERVAVAEQAGRKLVDEGWARLVAPDGSEVSDADAEAALGAGAWRSFPPAPEADYELVPTGRWNDWSNEARNTATTRLSRLAWASVGQCHPSGPR